MEKHFGNKLRDYEVNPPASAWENIENQLNNKKPGNGGWWKMIALAVLIPFLGLIGYGIYTEVADNNTEPAIIAQNQDQQNGNGQWNNQEGNGADETLGSENTDVNNSNSGGEENTGQSAFAGNQSSETRKSSSSAISNNTAKNNSVSSNKSSKQNISPAGIYVPAGIAPASAKASVPAINNNYLLAQKKKFSKLGPFDPIEDKKNYSPFLQRITITAIGAPESTFRLLSVYGIKEGPEDQVDFRNSIEGARLAGTFGLRFGYTLNPRITVNSGLFISQKGERIAGGYYPSHFTPGSDTAYRVYQINYNTTGKDNPTDNNYISALNSYTYLSIPAEVQYTFHSKRVRLYASGGVGFNYLMAANATIIEPKIRGANNAADKSIHRLNRLDMQLQGRLGIEYGLGKNVSFLMEPVYKRSVMSMLPSEYNMRHYHRSLGVAFGVQWRPFSE